MCFSPLTAVSKSQAVAASLAVPALAQAGSQAQVIAVAATTVVRVAIAGAVVIADRQAAEVATKDQASQRWGTEMMQPTNRGAKMNRIEHLLTCLAEECAEVQQAISKALRFGLHDGYPNAATTNAEAIGREFVDVVAVMEMLVDCGVIKLPPNRLARTEQKKSWVNEWMIYAAERGTLEPDPLLDSATEVLLQTNQGKVAGINFPDDWYSTT